MARGRCLLEVPRPAFEVVLVARGMARPLLSHKVICQAVPSPRSTTKTTSITSRSLPAVALHCTALIKIESSVATSCSKAVIIAQHTAQTRDNHVHLREVDSAIVLSVPRLVESRPVPGHLHLPPATFLVRSIYTLIECS